LKVVRAIEHYLQQAGNYYRSPSKKVHEVSKMGYGWSEVSVSPCIKSEEASPMSEVGDPKGAVRAYIGNPADRGKKCK